MFGGDWKVAMSDRTAQITEGLKALGHVDVLVGVPQASDSEAGRASNAELMFIHTNGSPLKGIPERPVIEPAIEADAEVISDILKDAMKSMLDGNKDDAMRLLEKAGLEGQAASQDWFDDPRNGWAPNSPATAKAKIKKGSTDPKPLIDTGELRRSITYVVRNEG